MNYAAFRAPPPTDPLEVRPTNTTEVRHPPPLPPAFKIGSFDAFLSYSDWGILVSRHTNQYNAYLWSNFIRYIWITNIALIHHSSWTTIRMTNIYHKMENSVWRQDMKLINSTFWRLSGTLKRILYFGCRNWIFIPGAHKN